VQLNEDLLARYLATMRTPVTFIAKRSSYNASNEGFCRYGRFDEEGFPSEGLSQPEPCCESLFSSFLACRVGCVVFDSRGQCDEVPRRTSRPNQVNPHYLAVEVDTKEVDTKLAHERGTRENHGLGCCQYYSS
jgi:hypothetical protein